MPTRVVLDGLDVPGPDGASVRERRDRFAATSDDQRRFLVCEPRGHDDTFAAVPLTPGDPAADVGLFFMDTEGYLDMCGHATIGAVTALVDAGRIDPADGLTVETPAGLVTATVDGDKDGVDAVTFENVPVAHVATRRITIPGYGDAPVDLVSAGNLCAVLDAGAVDAVLGETPAADLATAGTAVRDALHGLGPVTDPVSGRDQDVALVEFVEEDDPPRTAVVFGDGVVDRSPCGTGTSARLACRLHHGDLGVDESFEHVGPAGGVFRGRVTGVDDGVVTTEVTGTAHVTGRHVFVRGDADPLDPFRLD